MGGCYEARSRRPASHASAKLTARDPAALGSPTRLPSRLASGLAHALASRLACSRLLGGPASRRLLDLPFHYPLSHLVHPSFQFPISLEFESAPNKKRMSKFEDFVDIKLQFTRYGKAHSLKRVARNPHFSRVSNVVARRLQISPPLFAKARGRN